MFLLVAHCCSPLFSLLTWISEPVPAPPWPRAGALGWGCGTCLSVEWKGKSPICTGQGKQRQRSQPRRAAALPRAGLGMFVTEWKIPVSACCQEPPTFVTHQRPQINSILIPNPLWLPHSRGLSTGVRLWGRVSPAPVLPQPLEASVTFSLWGLEAAPHELALQERLPPRGLCPASPVLPGSSSISLASFFPHLCISLVSCCLPPASPLSLFQMLPSSSSLNTSHFLSDTLLLLYLSAFALSLLLSSTSRLRRRGGDDGLGAGVL